MRHITPISYYGMGQTDKNALRNGWMRDTGGNGQLARNRQRRANNYLCRHTMFS